jgi:hypothetical protein
VPSRVAINRERRQVGVEHIMSTVGDIGAIPVFSALAQAELERLARTSADIQLSPGEFAVHLPDDRKRFEIIVARDVGFGL